jgi:hypothetical protein
MHEAMHKAPHRLPVVLVGAALIVVLGAQIAWAAEERAYAAFYESSTDYHGVEATWSDPNWTGIPCPGSGTNRVNTAVNVYGTAANTWIQLGSQKRVSPPGCSVDALFSCRSQRPASGKDWRSRDQQAAYRAKPLPKSTSCQGAR